MNMNQTQLRAFLGGFGLTAVILLATGTWATNKPEAPARSTSIVWTR